MDVVFAVVVKYIKVLKLSADDWLFGYNFVWSLVASIIAIYCWHRDVVEFELKYLIEGSISGVCTMIGALLATHALKIDGAPQGPTVALCNSKLLLLVTIDSIIQRKLPPWMQWLGLIIGIIGTLVVSIPEELKKCLTCIFRQQR